MPEINNTFNWREIEVCKDREFCIFFPDVTTLIFFFVEGGEGGDNGRFKSRMFNSRVRKRGTKGRAKWAFAEKKKLFLQWEYLKLKKKSKEMI